MAKEPLNDGCGTIFNNIGAGMNPQSDEKFFFMHFVPDCQI
jgi:hypothetical protein